MPIPNISMVISTMNRNDHLRQTLKYNGQIKTINNITILDFGSTSPLNIEDIASTCPIKHIRINHNNRWSLARAYNLAIALTDTDFLIKSDADMYISQELIETAMTNMSDGIFITGNPFFKSGPLIVSKRAVELAGYFNEDLIGWGYEEVDLYSRLRSIGLNQKLVSHSKFKFIEHPDELRMQALPESTKEISNLSNIITSLFESGHTSTEKIIANLVRQYGGNDRTIFDDNWSDSLAIEFSRRISKRIQLEAFGVQPKYLLPLSMNLIDQQRLIYDKLERI